ncbi:hypothetical protein [Desulforhopalus singaporensis]|uniref:Tryptophan synthase subunit beta like protein n=1 Tax=Desulforhopalus singaporensis TaxID=91360 RepID=A0A1H0MXH4_9BACT|nr:hypothetical protein [Desulforhopalus singaporensis]SDO84820.1 hypothetical protein SAMN05660330_01218 [Desulforhopalus singaporensis]
MIYAERDENGNIIALRNNPVEPDQQEISTEELETFLSEYDQNKTISAFFRKLDNEVIRVLDDLVDLLVMKNIIKITDLPEQAQQKLGNRKRIRSKIQDNCILDEDEIL